ncbi:MAG: hypothetical protein Q9213_007050 [Squamulea squamosa]
MCGCSGANRQRSFERRRPPGLFPQVPEPPPALRGGAGRFLGPMSPQSPPGLDHDYYPWTPAAPEVPTSPTTTTTFSSLSSSPNSSLHHWLPKVFGQNRPATPFRQTGVVSNCFGVNIPGASERLAKEYDKLLDLPFEDGDLRGLGSTGSHPLPGLAQRAFFEAMLLAIDQAIDPKARLNTETLPDWRVGASERTLGLSSFLKLRA